MERSHKILWINYHLLEPKLSYNSLSMCNLSLAEHWFLNKDGKTFCFKQMIAFYGPVFTYEQIWIFIDLCIIKIKKTFCSINNVNYPISVCVKIFTILNLKYLSNYWTLYEDVHQQSAWSVCWKNIILLLHVIAY